LSVFGCLLIAVPEPASAQPEPVQLTNLTPDQVLAIAGRLIAAGRLDEAQALLDRLAEDKAGGTERVFLDGMVALARHDLGHAEQSFRAILDSRPELVRVRLELARTLYLERKDQAADYHFRLAIAQHPSAAVIANIARFREALRARRAWRANMEFGLAPDSNINSATNRDNVELFGLPFQLDAGAKARSGVGAILGGEANVRVLREQPVVLYLGAYGRAVRYSVHDFDDVYAGGEIGPEFRVGSGRLRASATGLQRWYGGRRLMNSFGGRLAYDRIVGGKLGFEASLAAGGDYYARRSDLDGWRVEAGLAADRAMGPATVGFAYAGLSRSVASDPGQSHWSARMGAGVAREIGWGLLPQFKLEAGRQWHDGPLAPFGRTRRDWSFQASASVTKRDLAIAGFAPSMKATYTHNASSIALYDQDRRRIEFGITRVF
jgi:hypothetical protein